MTQPSGSQRRLVALSEEEVERLRWWLAAGNTAANDDAAPIVRSIMDRYEEAITEEEAEAALNQRYGVPPEAASHDALYEKLTRFTHPDNPGGRT